jgi:hypothetical protein
VASGGRFTVPNTADPVILGFDGGTAAEASSTSPTVAICGSSVINGLYLIHHTWNALQGQVAGSGIRTMTRGDWGTSPSSQLMYNAPSGATMWWTVALGPSAGAYNCGPLTPNASTNTLYRASIQTQTNSSITYNYLGPARINSVQSNAGYLAGGYSGPAIEDQGTNSLNNIHIFGV